MSDLSWRETRSAGSLGTPRAPIVLEGVVALAHGLPEADVLRSGHEVQTFLGVAGDAIEQGAQES